MRPPSKIKTAKYVFLTLREALMNSILIIAIGSAGFFYIERMSLVYLFYFTTVLLMTVGYGDIYPVTSAGKLFATIYALVAGTVLLNNMSLISMIPLEHQKCWHEKKYTVRDEGVKIKK
jgi:Ion channel